MEDEYERDKKRAKSFWSVLCIGIGLWPISTKYSDIMVLLSCINCNNLSLHKENKASCDWCV